MVNIQNSGAIKARGANGQVISGMPMGGAGSGGMIIVGAKDSNSTGGTLNTDGGTATGVGGDGRTRYDGFYRVTGPNILPTLQNNATNYIGPTIDTLSYTRRRVVTIYGTQDPDADVRLWIKGDNAYPSWTNLTVPPVNVTRNGRRWSFTTTLPAGGFYYVVAAQFVPTPSEVPYNREPIWVMAQTAANIIYADIHPEIEGDTLKYFGTVGCEKSRLDSFFIWNDGDEDLIVQAPTPNPAGPFRVVSPTFPQRIPMGDTVWVRVVYEPTTPGQHIETITLPNNDPRVIPGEARPRAQWQVQLRGRKLRIEPSLSRRTIVFQTACVDSAQQAYVEYMFQGDTISYIQRIERLGTGPEIFRIESPTRFPSDTIKTGNGTIPIRIGMRASTPGTHADSFRVWVSPCDSPLVFVVRSTVVELIAELTPNPLDFGPVRIYTTSSLPVTLTNRGSATFTIGNVYWRVPDPTLRVPTDPAGRILPPGVSTSFNVDFRPVVAGTVNSELCVELLGVCRDTICIPVTGRGITSLLVLSRRVIELHADSCSPSPPDVIDTFRITNLGAVGETVTSATVLGGLVTLTSTPPLPPNVTLQPDEFIEFTVRWSPGVPSTQTEMIRILTTSAEPAQRVIDVELRLVRETSLVALFDGPDTLRSIDFGQTFQCDSTAEKTIELRSLGTLDETVNARFASGAAFDIEPNPDYALPRGGSQSLTVRFVPTMTGEYLDTLIVRSLLCETEIRIPVTGRYVGLNYNAGGTAFGQTNVGFTVTGTAFLSYEASPLNTTKTVVVSAFIRQTGTAFAITSSSLPATLAPGEMTTVEIGFTPSAEQVYSAELCFVLSEPCPDTICVPLTGEGIQANLLVRQNTLNFGPRFACQDTTLDLTIENTGNAPVQILDVRITGPDAVAFERLTPFTPFALAGKTSVTYTFRFVPARSNGDGMKRATAEIVSDDPNRPLILVTLIGERRSQALATPAALDFGRVTVGTSATLDVTIESRTPGPLLISGFRIAPPFQVISPTPPVTIPPFGSITVRVQFTPTDTLPVAATLIVDHTEPCTDSTVIPVTGEGKMIRTAIMTIEVPAGLRGAPGDRIAIPIIMSQAQLVAESEATTFIAVLRFDRELLWPEGARAKGQPLARPNAPMVGSGRIVSSTVSGTDRVVTVEIANQPMPTQPDTLGYLDAMAMLSDRVTTPITLDTVYFTDGPALVATSSGSFTLEGYCEIDSNRFVRISGTAGFKSVAPNPFNSSIEIIFETSEDGATSLLLRSTDGRSVAMLVDGEALAPGAHRRVFSGEHLSSGVYLLELVTPTERHVQRVILVK
jgi:hypothetical protein